MKEKKLYYIQSQKGELLELFIENNLIAIGWADLGNLNKIKNVKELKTLFEKKYPILTNDQSSSKASILLKFIMEIKKGDFIITFNKNDKNFYIGEITSSYKFISSYSETPNIRYVEWKFYINKNILSQETKYKLGAIRTVFEVNESAKKEILKKMKDLNLYRQKIKY